jgi:hypothetical protein
MPARTRISAVFFDAEFGGYLVGRVRIPVIVIGHSSRR